MKKFLTEHWTTLSIIGWAVVIAALFTGFLFTISKSKQVLRPAEYEGRIVEKWAGYNESREGSFPYFRLLVETKNGQKLTVAVDSENYQRARVGMLIKKTQKGIELTSVKTTTSVRSRIMARSDHSSTVHCRDRQLKTLARPGLRPVGSAAVIGRGFEIEPRELSALDKNSSRPVRDSGRLLIAQQFTAGE